ncbi:MAG: hypothetical protein IPL07_21965 [Acidimicrobiaceae bacterium]|nr:hypothetical protein [Acidimicrobiaceae bacterium]
MELDSLTDLETRGFVVLRGFLTPEEVQLLRDDHAQLSLDDNRNFNAKTPNADVIGRLTPRFDDVLRQVNEQTTVRADVHVPDTSVYFAVRHRGRCQLPLAPGPRELLHRPEPLRLRQLLHADHQAGSGEVEHLPRSLRRAAAGGPSCPTTSSCATARATSTGRWPVAGDQR